ncbi:hypothetical protein ABPG77_006515 [Micractinium sp. CCAP 211/92]
MAAAALLLAIGLVLARGELITDPTLLELQCDGSEAPGDSCWVAASTFPRQCNCVRNACPSASISQTTTCYLCDRGYGIYTSEDECMAAEAEVQAVGIDPSTYPAPSFPPTACPASARTTGADQRSNCPFQQPGLKRWEDPATWGGRVPSPSSNITLPANTKVLLSACSVPPGTMFRQIVVPPGSELIFAEEDMALDVGSLVVGGALRAGGPSCRLASRLTLTFHPVAGIDPLNMALWVLQGGQLDLHGKEFAPTWTRLAQTANAGASAIQLQDSVASWEPGQQVVLTTTIWKDEQENQNEVATVKAVSPDGLTLYLTQPLAYQHYGGPEYQAEVGLLSRYILVQGDASTESTQRGVHIRVEGAARMRGVQAYRAGQSNIVGAYPFHWHMVNNATGQMATDCSVYRSFYRCFTLHDTSDLLLQNNVGFHIAGHCFYIEDGVEEHNTLDHNLAAFVHVIGSPAAGVDQTGQTFAESATQPQPSDAAASGFYVTNPNNRLTNNAASGGYSGFFYPVLPKPIGFSRSVNIVPASRPMLAFDGNTAHSSGYMWFQAGCLYFGGQLYEDATQGNKLYYNGGRHEFTTMTADGKSPAFFQLNNTKVFLCMVGHMSWGQRFEVTNYQAYDIVRGATLFGQALLKNAYISVQSANQRSNFPGRLDDLPPIAGFQWYDTRTMTIIKDTTFANYKWQPQLGNYRMAVFYSMTHSDEYKPMAMSSTQNITLLNCDHQAIARVDVKQTGSSRMFNWQDYDGSATQRTGPTIVGSWPSWWQLAPDCSYENEWNAWVCPWRQGQEVGRVELRIPGFTKAWDTGTAVPPTPDNEIGYVALFGYRGSQARTMTITKNEGVTGVTGSTGWYFHFPAGAPKYQEVWLSQLPVGDQLIYATRFPAGTKFTIARTFKWYQGLSRTVTAATSLQQMLAGDGLLYFFDGHHLFIKMVDPGNSETQNIDFCRDNVCVRGSRYWSLYYSILTSLSCSGYFCPMAEQPDDIPDAVAGTAPLRPSPYARGNSSSPAPPAAPVVPVPAAGACNDIQPNDGSTCAQKKGWGQCGADWMARAGWCAQTCGRCGTTPGTGGGTTPTATCTDVQPNDGSTCAQKKGWGQCGADWMLAQGWCAATCGRCSTPPPQQGPSSAACTDVTPPGGFTCAQQKAWGKCSDAWLQAGGFCKATCGSCTASGTCTDIQPPGGFTCAQQKAWGKCSDAWLQAGGFCKATCGGCPTSGTCTDIQPPGGYTCAQQKAWGKCSDAWLQAGGFCKATCGSCTASGTCTDTQPPGGFTCAQQKAWGKCSDAWLQTGGFCKATCGRCTASGTCTDTQPPGGYTCAQQAAWGKCKEAWMSAGGYCAATCRRCLAGASMVTGNLRLWPSPALCFPGLLPRFAADVAPPGLFSCKEHEAWGLCPALNGTGFCAASCGVCTPNIPCDDVPTPDGRPCSQTVATAKCASPYVQRGGYCRASCGRCQPQGAAAAQVVACSDVPTPDGVTCTEQLYAGGCNQTYVVLGNYCNLTCGRCTSVKGARKARTSAGAPVPTASAAAGPLAA